MLCPTYVVFTCIEFARSLGSKQSGLMSNSAHKLEHSKYVSLDNDAPAIIWVGPLIHVRKSPLLSYSVVYSDVINKELSVLTQLRAVAEA